jgi:hypothetical protein
MFSRWKHIFQGIVRSGQKRRIWLISRGSGILPLVQDHRKRGLHQLLGLESEMVGSFREDLGDFSFNGLGSKRLDQKVIRAALHGLDHHVLVPFP